jgi:hypothetical protein
MVPVPEPAIGGWPERPGAAGLIGMAGRNQLTPSFFCRLEDDVVYWNTSRLSG